MRGLGLFHDLDIYDVCTIKVAGRADKWRKQLLQALVLIFGKKKDLSLLVCLHSVQHAGAVILTGTPGHYPNTNNRVLSVQQWTLLL